MSESIYFHVTSSLNRGSIREHGLDWSRMGAAWGIAGSREPEAEGCFLSGDESESEYFVRMNNTGGPVDVWVVRGVDSAELVTTASGYNYLPRRVPPECLELTRTDIKPQRVQARLSEPAIGADGSSAPNRDTSGLFFEL